MLCNSCGSELNSQGSCPRCASTPAAASTVPTGDPFVQSGAKPQANRWKAPLFAFLSVLLWALVVFLNYLRALRWAGVINAESFGYMIGGILVSYLFGLLGMFVVKKLRGKEIHSASKNLGIACIAVLASFLVLGQEVAAKSAGKLDRNQRIGELLKEAAGKKAASEDSQWWDSASRDFFRDILQTNQRYAAEVAALDNSAIQDLYSVASYSGKPRMQKVIAQLQAALAVDVKYASLDPIVKRMEDRIAKADVSENQKQEFLKGFKGSFEKSIAPRNGLLRAEETWMISTIDLYGFVIAHSSEYAIKRGKLYFRNDATRDEFVSQQSKSIALHNDFLKVKAAFDGSRQNKLDQIGVSPSDLTPQQLGKPK